MRNNSRHRSLSSRARLGLVGGLAALVPAVTLAEAPELFEPVTMLATPQPLGRQVVRAVPVRLDLRLLKFMHPDATVTLNVAPELSFEGIVERVISRDDDRFTVAGSLRDTDSGTFMIVVEKDVAAAAIRVPQHDQLFTMRYIGNGVYLVRDIDSSRYLPEADPIPPPIAGPANDRAESLPLTDEVQKDGGAPEVYGGCPRPPPVLDVLIVYTTLARDAAGGTNAIHALCQLAIDENNRIYANSRIDARMRLVYRGWVDYDEDGTNNEHLDRLQSSIDGVMDGVHALRDEHGADFVSLLVDDPGTPGIGNCRADAGRAFSVVNWDYIADRFTLSHEIGHNFGAAHNRADATPFCNEHPYSYAWYYTGDSGTEHGTVMSYVGTRIPYFSNPNVWFDGHPTGVDIGDPDEAFNARTIQLRRSDAEGFRGAVFETWVDFDALPVGFGSFDLPYNTLNWGVNEAFTVPHGSPRPELWIKTGSTSETIRITKRLTLRNCGGTVRIGVPP